MGEVRPSQPAMAVGTRFYLSLLVLLAQHILEPLLETLEPDQD